jgi:DNA-binding CsgD family transcriptional regulator
LSVSAEQLGTTPDAWLALLEAELGETDGARRHLEGIVQDDFQAFEEDQDRLSGLATAADACSIVGDADIARALYRELVQGEGRNPSSELGASGSSFRELGQLAALMGEDALAREHFDAALDFNRRMGARPWSAWTEIAYAEFLMTSEKSTDRVRALELTAAARATSVSLGMVPILLRCDRLLAAAATAPVGAAPETPGGLTSRERDVLRLLAGGMSNLEIAAALVISVRTVERHITNIYGKIDARGRADATAFAIRAGIA